MGIVVDPPPFHFGADCAQCTPHLWKTGETPMYVFAHFSGIENCGVSPHPAPNGCTFLLQQDPIAPCRYLHQGDVWQVDYTASWEWPNNSRVRLADHHGFSFFVGIGAHCPPEIIRYVNAQNACLFMWAGALGVCHVDWSGVLLNVVEEFGIERKPKLMRESRSVDVDSYVYKLCSLYQRTNVKFKISL